MEQPAKRPECCMCGDYGLSEELFQCKICHFRSQHRYCSNLYPKAELYRVCNWCLSRRKTESTLNSSSSSLLLQCKNRSRSGEEDIKKRGRETNDLGDQNGLVNGSSRREQRSPERTRRRRIITTGELEEKLRLRRTKSDDIMKQNQVVRNKVRRYKLLDEVSS